jgi:hypothetical protein
VQRKRALSTPPELDRSVEDDAVVEAIPVPPTSAVQSLTLHEVVRRSRLQSSDYGAATLLHDVHAIRNS